MMTKRLTAREKNQRAFLRLRKRYAATHAGQWIGLVDGKVAAIAPTFEELHDVLQRIEPQVQRRMVFQAGADWLGKRVFLPLFKIEGNL